MLNFFRRKKQNIYDQVFQNFISEFGDFEWEDIAAVKELISDGIIIDDANSSNKNLGESKFGGKPDLPASILWPKFENRSMQFFCQLNLLQISNYHRNQYLPNTGILYFFDYFSEPTSQFGAEYEFRKNKKEYTVIYYDGIISDLKRTNFPNDIYEGYQFPERIISFQTIF